MAEAIGKPATRQPGDLGTGSSPPRRLEESALLRRYTATRSPEVRDEIVKRFMPLARSLALRYRGGSESVDDLVQVASLGLVKAVDRFEPDRGGPFTAFAVPTILGELRRHFRDHVWNLRLPRSLQEMALKVDSAVDELTEELKRTPTPTQIAAHIGVATEQVLESIAATQARRTLSLDAPAGATRGRRRARHDRLRGTRVRPRRGGHLTRREPRRSRVARPAPALRRSSDPAADRPAARRLADAGLANQPPGALEAACRGAR